MSVTIGSNPTVGGIIRNLGTAEAKVRQNTTRLSTGLRINSASDDAASLSISESLNATNKVYGQAIRNVSDGVSALSIAQGAL